ncbi:MAG: NUDIX hydrolase N-terminal domain-containing protein [Micromonosporaceae bacterium]
MGEDQPEQGARLHALAVEIAALAQNGLNYANRDTGTIANRYEVARYRRLQQISAEMMSLASGHPAEAFHHAIEAEFGHATPKVDVRGALFDGDGRVLLVREKIDGRWTLPGGWADALDAPTEAVVREVAEEAGLKVRVTRLAAVYDGFRRNGHPTAPFHIYKLMFLLERLDDAEPVAGLDDETTGVGFFALDALPELSSRRTSEEQLHRLYQHQLNPAMPADVD